MFYLCTKSQGVPSKTLSTLAYSSVRLQIYTSFQLNIWVYDLNGLQN